MKWAATATPEFTFGPVPSRRLGRSLGINNIPPKVCTYSCVYCQAGRTTALRTMGRSFYDPAALEAAVAARVSASRAAGEPIDYLTFVPDGEPTLDRNLGDTIERLKATGLKVAVITNGSLLTRPRVRAALARADYVSLKVDAARQPAWLAVTRPHGQLRLPDVLSGMRLFAATYAGVLATETLLVAGVNDAEGELRATAAAVAELFPAVAYLAVPTRPPAEPWVRPPGSTALARAWEVFHGRLRRVELLLGYEGDAFAATGDPVRDLLSITAVHPMRETAALRLRERGGAPRVLLSELVEAGLLSEVRYGSARYYLRPINPPAPGIACRAGH